MSDLITPTEDEIKNGWTAETLTEYVKQQKKSQAYRANIIEHPYRPWGERDDPNRPEHTDFRYNPLRW